MNLIDRLRPTKEIDRRIFVFTVHKAASLGVYDVMRQVAQTERWPIYSANLKLPNLIEPEDTSDTEFSKQLAGRSGFVGPIRMPVPVKGLLADSDKVVIHLRDPRDVLVSMFFSWVYSHPGVDEGVRERHQEHGIERFVMHEAIALKEKYQLYIDHYLSLPQTTLLRYEDFVLDRPAWLRSFLIAAGANPDRRRYQKLALLNRAASVTKENVRAHIRKATPGDHREKLEASTLEKLNKRLESILTALNYAQ